MSDWEVIVPPPAEKKIRAIPHPDKERVLRAIDALHNGLSGDIKPLVGRAEWRLRVGKLRVLLDVSVKEKIVIVLDVAPRGQIYKNNSKGRG